MTPRRCDRPVPSTVPLREDVSSFSLTPTPSAEPGLPGMAEWRARQRQKAAADLLRAEIVSLQPNVPEET
jgi:hypothetical protein